MRPTNVREPPTLGNSDVQIGLCRVRSSRWAWQHGPPLLRLIVHLTRRMRWWEEVEIELQPAGCLREEGTTTLVAPTTIATEFWRAAAGQYREFRRRR